MSWWIDFYRDMDTRDIDLSSAWYGENIELRAGNSPAVHGKVAATASLRHVLEQLDDLRHELGTAVVSGNEVFLECQVTYGFKNGRHVTVPAAVYLQRVGESIQILHVYQHIPGLE